MAYQALYRKWRPNSFEEVIGQDHIVRTLKNQIKTERTSHAYLFCGTRGTGKTTMAKIFARAVNCEHPVEGSPCNVCDSCKHMLNGQSLNVIEIDAASNNGVDNIREIREEVRYTPTEGKYKVYIIDEVHMLSTGAFNALLKTLEEPPAHVKFILATTEPHKIPATILSRCQRYDLKRISTEAIAKLLGHYLTEEGVEFEEKAVRFIAKTADGSMRDGLSLLDQCMAFYMDEIMTFDKVLEVLGAVDTQVFSELTEALMMKDAKKCLDLLDQIVTQGRDLSQFLLDEISYLRNLLMVKTISDPKEFVDVTAEVMASLKEQAEKTSEALIMHLIRALSTLESDIKYMTGKRTLIEIEFIKLCRPKLNIDEDAILARLDQVEHSIEEGIKIIPQMGENDNKGTLDSAINVKMKNQSTKEIDTKAFPEDIKKAINGWTKLVMQTSGLLKATLKEVLPFYMDDDRLTIICKNEIQKNTLSEDINIGKIKEALFKIHQKEYELNIVEEWEYSASKQADFDAVERAVQKIRQKINFEIEIE